MEGTGVHLFWSVVSLFHLDCWMFFPGFGWCCGFGLVGFVSVLLLFLDIQSFAHLSALQQLEISWPTMPRAWSAIATKKQKIEVMYFFFSWVYSSVLFCSTTFFFPSLGSFLYFFRFFSSLLYFSSQYSVVILLVTILFFPSLLDFFIIFSSVLYSLFSSLLLASLLFASLRFLALLYSALFFTSLLYFLFITLLFTSLLFSSLHSSIFFFSSLFYFLFTALLFSFLLYSTLPERLHIGVSDL